MHPLTRKLIRDLWHMRGMAIAIALVIGAGLATLVMSLGALHSLDETRIAYYERYRFADVFASVKRAPLSLLERIRDVPGVMSVDARIVKDVILDVPGLNEPATGRLVSVPERGEPRLNALALRHGRHVAPGNPDEIVASESFVEAHGYRPGDSVVAIINGHRRSLKIVGTALSPEYVYSIAPGALLPDDERFGVFWMGEEALAAAFDLDESFNDVTIGVQRGASVPEVLRRLDLLLEPYGGTGAIERKDQISNWFLMGELEQLGTIATIMPTIFLVVSVFLLNLVVSRVVDTEREQIGLLKAIGYGNAAIAWHYLVFVLAIVSVGVVMGFATGAWLGRQITEIYAQIYRFPFLYFRLSPAVFAGGALISVAAAAIGTFSAIRRAVTVPPAEAMTPPPPPLYRPSPLHLRRLIARLDQPTLMILRHIVRWPVRSATTVLGVSLAVAVLLTSLHWLDAIDHMIQFNFFQAQRQDVTVTLVEAQEGGALHTIARLPGVQSVQPFRSVPARFRAGHRVRLEPLTGVPHEAELNRVLDISGRVVALPDDGIVLSAKLAELLHLKSGDFVTVEVLEGHRPKVDLRVSGIVDTYLGTPAYIRLPELNRLMLEGPVLSGAYLQVDELEQAALFGALKETPRIAGVALRSSIIASFRDTLAETINFIVTFYVVFACLLASGVVYNSMRISLSERGRELASLRVLGFTRLEVSYILLGEVGLLTVIALPIGCLVGHGLSHWMTGLFETELYRIPMVINLSTYGISVAVVLAASLLCGAIVRQRVDRLDLVGVLKTRE